MKRFILSMLFSLALFMTACKPAKDKPVVYNTTDQKGYCYTDGLLWYIFYYDMLTNSYVYSGTANNFTAYDSTTPVNWSPTSETVSNYAENADAIEASSGEYSGGPEASASESDTSGIEGSAGEDAGGSDSGSSDSGSSDSGGSDSGGSDGGGGDGGGGGE